MIKIINTKSKTFGQGFKVNGKVFSINDRNAMSDRCSSIWEDLAFTINFDNPDDIKKMFKSVLSLDKRMNEFVCIPVMYTNGYVLYLRKCIGHERRRYKYSKDKCGQDGPLGWRSKIMPIVENWIATHQSTYYSHKNWLVRNTHYKGYDIVFIEFQDKCTNYEYESSNNHSPWSFSYYPHSQQQQKKKFVTLKQAMDKAIAQYTKSYFEIQECFFSNRDIEHGFFNAILSRYSSQSSLIDEKLISQFVGDEYFECIAKYFLSGMYRRKNAKWFNVHWKDVERFYRKKFERRRYQFFDKTICKKSYWFDRMLVGDQPD